MLRGISGERAAATAAAAAATAATASRGPNGESVGTEMGTLTKLCLPVLATNLSQALLPITSFAYAGRLTDAASLPGLGLGNCVSNVSGVCLFYGMGSGIDVLCTQAFGAKEYRLVGVVFARGTLLTTFLFVPVAILWYYMEGVLLFVGQEPNLAHIAGTFCRAYLWGMIPFTVFENLKRCLQAQNHGTPVMYVAALGLLANVGFHHLTMAVLGMGVYGAGLALSLTGMFLLAALIAVTWFFRLGDVGEGCWSGIWSRKDVFDGWLQYLAESLPGLAGLVIEWSSIEASTFLAGLLNEEQLATQIMILSAYAIVFQFSLSISISANILVGNHLGDKKAGQARKAAWCGVQLALCAAIVAGLGLWFGKGQWPRLYDVSEAVLDKIVELTPIYVVAQMIDMGQNVCTGILKGMGKQCVQAWAALVGFWIVGVPLAAILGVYLEWGVKGLWVGMAAGEGPLLVFYLYKISTTDWNQCVREAEKRVKGQPGSSPLDPVPGSPKSSTDLSDYSDSDSAGGEEVTPFSGRGERRTEDEETGGYYGGVMAIVRSVSEGNRVELDVGESSRLVAAAEGPRRSGSGGGGGGGRGGSDSDSADGLIEMQSVL